MVKVLDAHALLTFFEKEPGYEKVQAALMNAVEKDVNLLMTSVNYGEVYYIVLRECGQQKADEIERIIRTLPIEIVDADIAMAKEAARFKAKYKISYADCFAAALTRMCKGELTTGDCEFSTIESDIKISWIS